MTYYANPTTGSVWTGALPTHASWNPIAQVFAFEPAPGAEPASEQERALAREALEMALSGPPKARRPYQNGYVTQPAFRLACPTCKSLDIVVPVEAQPNDRGGVDAWFGKGVCRCPGCGYSGTQVQQRRYSMFEFPDLIELRANEGPILLDRMA